MLVRCRLQRASYRQLAYVQLFDAIVPSFCQHHCRTLAQRLRASTHPSPPNETAPDCAVHQPLHVALYDVSQPMHIYIYTHIHSLTAAAAAVNASITLLPSPPRVGCIRSGSDTRDTCDIVSG